MNVTHRQKALLLHRKDFDKAQCPFMSIESRKPRVAGTYLNTMKIIYSKSIVRIIPTGVKLKEKTLVPYF